MATAAVLLGSAGLAGWIWDVGALKSVIPGMVAMNANTAAALVLAGASLGLLASRRSPGTLRWIGRGAAGLVLLLGLLTLGQDVLGRDLGIDQLLFREPAGSLFTRHPGRMAWLTALSFALLGGALLLLESRRASHLVQGLAAVTGLVALLAVGRYVGGDPGLLFGKATPVALHTAFGLLALALGVMAATVDRGFLARVRRQLPLIGIAAAILLMLSAGAASFFSTRRMHGAFGWIGHTHEVRWHLNATGSHVQNVGASVRGFLLTGEEAFLDPVAAAREGLTRELRALERLTADNPDQQQRLAALGRLIARRLEIAEESVRLRREEGLDAAAAYLASGAAERLVTEIGTRLAEMNHVEEELLARRRAAAETATTSSLVASVSLQTLGLGLLLALFVLGRRLNATLEERVLERTGELARSNRALRMLSSCNQALMRATDEAQLVQAVCDLLVRDGGFRFSFVAYAEHDEARSLRTVARAGVGAEQLATASLTWADTEGGRGPTGIAIRTGLPAVLNDLDDHPELARWRDAIRRLGLASAAALPLALEGRVLGALVILSAGAAAFDEPELEILSELSEDLSFGIGALRARAAHQALEARYAGVLGSMMEGAQVIGFDWRYLYLNEVAAAHGRRSVADLLGRTMKEAYPGIESTDTFTALRECMESRIPRRFENRFEYDDGSCGHFDLSVTPVPEGIFILSHDITERRRAEEALRRLNAELEERVRSRTAELAAARDEADSASRAKSAFLASMSHELRTPLNSLLILSKVLAENEDGNLTAGQVEHARVVHGAGNDLLHLVDDVLDLARVESGRMPLDFGDVTFASIAGDVESTFRPVTDGKGLTFRTEVDAALPESMRTDGKRVGQILKNLISNACKFTGKGGVSLRISLLSGGLDSDKEALRTASGIVTFAVTDTGIGIGRDEQQLVFEAFRQADGTTSRRYGGTGLGLSISRELAKVLGGEIRLESEPDRGSTFTLCLPLDGPLRHASRAEEAAGGALSSHAGPGPDARHEERPAAAPSWGLPPGGLQAPRTATEEALAGRKVLIVDDDVRSVFALTSVLERHGMTVLHAEGGRKAISVLAESSDVDLVLMDVMMPELDGCETTREIRRDPRFERLPIVALTAGVMKGDRERCMEAGMNDYVTKPVDVPRLLSLLRVWLSD